VIKLDYVDFTVHFNRKFTFYISVVKNDIAREIIQQDKLREFAVVLTGTIR